jgi:hypothetical protein
MTNPFYIKQVPLDAPFCNRAQEMADLEGYAESKNNVVIHSPRRFGKTSLVRRVQKRLADRGAVVIYADFFGIGSVDEVAARMAEAVFRVTREREPIWKSAVRFITSFRPILRPNADGGFDLSVEHAGGPKGLQLLKDTLVALGRFIEKTDNLVNIALDEFQEIVTLADSNQIEAVMRTEIQQHQASYFFVGSQRRILKAIFDEESRPFYRSAFDYQVMPLPAKELAEFIQGLFATNGKACGDDEAMEIVRITDCYPYYAQKLSHFVFDGCSGTVTETDVKEAFTDLIYSEGGVFEARVQPLPSQQRLFLRAIAQEPTKTPFSQVFTRTHSLGSTGALQNSLKQLEGLDYIERVDEYWRVVDPIFRQWLTK